MGTRGEQGLCVASLRSVTQPVKNLRKIKVCPALAALHWLWAVVQSNFFAVISAVKIVMKTNRHFRDLI